MDFQNHHEEENFYYMDAPKVKRCQFIIWGIRHKHDPNIGIKVPY